MIDAQDRSEETPIERSLARPVTQPVNTQPSTPVSGSEARELDIWWLARFMAQEGVPLVELLEVARDHCQDPWMKHAVEEMRVNLLSGISLSETIPVIRDLFPVSDLFPDSFRYAVFAGEQTGCLAEAMDWYAGEIFSSVPSEWRRIDLLSLYANAGVPIDEVLESDLYLREHPDVQAYAGQLLKRTHERGDLWTDALSHWQRGQADLD